MRLYEGLVFTLPGGKVRCGCCGRFAHRSIIGTVCHACIAREAGYKSVAAWRAAMIERADRAVREWEDLVAARRP